MNSITFPFSTQIHSNQPQGHLLFKDCEWPQGVDQQCGTLIVGGGIAGLSAAATLLKTDFILCEMNQTLAGTAGAFKHRNQQYAIGAHYDLPYPSYYGKEVIAFLEKLSVITFDAQEHVWQFTDRQFSISEDRQEQSLVNGQYQADILSESKFKRFFDRKMWEFAGHMVLPTREIDDDFHYLNSISFADFLFQHKISSKLMSGINYKMRDDYGANAHEISALAGIHYYVCRPAEQEGDVFSPPQGNAYFAQKIAAQIPDQYLKMSHLVKKISKTDQGFTAEVLHLADEIQYKIHSKHIIYAGMKPALQRLYPPAYALFQDVKYSAWLSIQFVMKESFIADAFWQNEILFDDIITRFLGFVDSATQHRVEGAPRVLTAYFCFPPEECQMLMDIHLHHHKWMQDAVDLMGIYFKADVMNEIQESHTFVHGHAMPIPAPGYLFKDRNKSVVAEQGFYFAGVDNGRLPLFFEAVDSGIQAAECVKRCS